MQHAADDPNDAVQQSRLRGLGSDIAPKLFVTLVAAGVSALLIPWITGKWQDHKQQLELRTSLATEMSRAYTSVIITGRFVTGGLIYSGSTSPAENTAVTQNAWNGAVQNWLVDSGTIQAELTGRYGATGIASEWRDFANAVTRYMQIGSQVPPTERPALLHDERGYVHDPNLRWAALARTKGFKSPDFKTSYKELGAWLQGSGAALVQEELRLNPHV